MCDVFIGELMDKIKNLVHTEKSISSNFHSISGFFEVQK
jgi:hypothetical protein